MSNHTPMPVTEATPLEDPVRQGLANPEVARSLMLLVRNALGRYPNGLTHSQRAIEAEEMFQEVAKCAMASAHRFDPNLRLLPWLGGIVWHLAQQRRPARCASTEPATLAETVLDRQRPVPEDVAGRLDCDEILRQLLPGDAQLLRLHAEGQTAQEIAEQLHLTAGNVRVRLSRILKRVRAMVRTTEAEADND